MSQTIYNRYLNILRIVKKRPGLPALTEIVTAHLAHVPFENISKLYYLKKQGLRTVPPFDQYIDGMEKYHFGGTCYANNYYLNRLLEYLGYDVRLCGADMRIPDAHLVNIVKLEQREYLVDVGYGAPFLSPMPLDLSKDYEILRGSSRYVLKPLDERGYSQLQYFRNGSRKHGYTVKPQPRSISEFEEIIASSMKGDSTFLNAVLLVKYESDSSLMVHNLSLIEQHGETVKTTSIPDREALVGQIEKHFQIPEDISREALSLIKNFTDAWN